MEWTINFIWEEFYGIFLDSLQYTLHCLAPEVKEMQNFVNIISSNDLNLQNIYA